MLARLWRSTFGLVAMVAVGFSLVTVGIGLIAFEIAHEAFEEQLDHRIAAEQAALLAELREDGLAGVAQIIRQREARRSSATLEYLLVDRQGRHLAGAMQATLPQADGYEEFLHYRRGAYVGIAQSITTTVEGGRLVVAADRQTLREMDRLLLSLLAGALALILLLGIASSALIGWIIRQRLAIIDGTAKAIIAGDLDRRIPQDGSGSEFDQLAGTLNRMLDRISGLMDSLRQVSSDVAHDLRTPLTRLLNRLDGAIEAQDAQESRAEIEAARLQASELLEIFASLLRISEVEGLAERLPRQPLNLSDLLRHMVETYRPDFEAGGHRLILDSPGEIVMEGDRRLLSQAIANLLDNALRYTPSGTTITLSAQETAQEICIAYDDDGPGVDEADPHRLFQRFARSAPDRSVPGHGLGLTLVSAIMSAHGGRANLTSNGGLHLRLLIPRRPD